MGSTTSSNFIFVVLAVVLRTGMAFTLAVALLLVIIFCAGFFAIFFFMLFIGFFLGALIFFLAATDNSVWFTYGHPVDGLFGYIKQLQHNSHSS